MHRIHNIYLKSLYDKRMCEKYIQLLSECYSNDYNIEKETLLSDNMKFHCYKNQSSFSNNAICSSVNSCGVTLK